MNNVVMSSECEIPVLGGMYKDHEKGRKFRPWVNGNLGPLCNCSEILSDILLPYMHEIKSKMKKGRAVSSTEELIANID